MFNNCQLRSHEYLQVYRTTLEREAMCPHYTFTQNLFTTHTYLTFAFSLINVDDRNTAVDPRWGRVIHQTLPSLASLAPPIQEGSGNQTSAWAHRRSAYTQLSPLYPSLYPYVTHVMNYSRPSTAFPYCKRRKAGRGLGTRLLYHSVSNTLQSPFYMEIISHEVDKLT